MNIDTRQGFYADYCALPPDDDDTYIPGISPDDGDWAWRVSFPPFDALPVKFGSKRDAERAAASLMAAGVTPENYDTFSKIQKVRIMVQDLAW